MKYDAHTIRRLGEHCRDALDPKRVLVFSGDREGEAMFHLMTHAAEYPDIFGWDARVIFVGGYDALGGISVCSLDQKGVVGLEEHYPPKLIWRTVVAKQAAMILDDQAFCHSSWADTSRWVRSNPERVSDMFLRANRALDAWGQEMVIVFNDVHTIYDDPSRSGTMVKGLLELALWFKSIARIHLKVILPEADEHAKATWFSFPDSSKLLYLAAHVGQMDRDSG